MSKDMNYSCAIFPDLDSDISSDNSAYHTKQVKDHDANMKDPLYEAQVRKMAHICQKADIRPDQRVRCLLLVSFYHALTGMGIGFRDRLRLGIALLLHCDKHTRYHYRNNHPLRRADCVCERPD